MHEFDTFVRIYLCSVSLSGNIADAVNVTEIGAFDREERKEIGEQEVAKRGLIGETLSGAFEDGFLACPQAGESHVGAGCLVNLSQFVVVHRITGNLLIVGFHRLDIDTYGAIIGHTDDSLVAMTQVEMNVGMANDAGLAVWAIFEQGLLLDAILFAQGLAQEQVGHRILKLLMHLTKGQRLTAPPLGELGERRGEVNGFEMIVVEEMHKA